MFFRRAQLSLQRAALVGAALVFTGQVGAATITGTVFEDRNYGGGAGRSLLASGGQPLAGVRVELYRQSNGNFVDSATTDVNGLYSLSSGNNTNIVIVRVVNGSVRSVRTGGSSCTTCVPVQTYRTDASSGSASAVTNRVGGESPALSDAAQNTGNYSNLNTASQAAQSITTVAPATSGATISGVDFGFNFDTVVNTRDASSCASSGSGSTFHPCQGNLRQFIINSNALGGEGALTQSGSGQLDGSTSTLPSGSESSIFMIPSTALTSGVATITLASALPTVSGASTRLDATTQTVNIGNTNSGTLGTGGSVGVDGISLPLFQRPEVQLNCGGTVLTLSGSTQTISGFALRQGYILLSGVSGTARNNLVGMTATGSSADDSPDAYGITFSATGATVRNNFVTVNNSSIRSDGGSTGSIVTLNEVARPSAGHTNTFDGILLINGASSVQVVANLVRDQRGGGIELGFGAATDSYANVQVTNNTVQNNGFDSGSTPSTERLGMVGYNYTGSNVVFSRNRVQSNGGPGIVLLGVSGTIVSQNSFSSNGGATAVSGLAIDLDPTTRDPNSLGTPNGVTINDANDADSGPNGLLNYPVITSAIIANGELSVTGFARPGSAIELYAAQSPADPSGFGEGLTYLTTLTEGGGTDLNTTTGTYGPAAINGLLQGTDTTNRFAFRMAIPAGVSIGSVLTSTATLSGQTSEFGGNVAVTSGPTLTHLKSVSVLSDPLNNTSNPKSIPGAMEIYTLRLTNQGSGTVDNNTVAIVDAVPANTALYVQDLGVAGSGPLAFTNGTPSSALTYTFSGLANGGDDLEFSNNGGSSWAYTPVANANGCDPAVTHIRVKPKGTMAAASGAGNPYFEVRFRVRVN
ncbi:MAG TPA: right-handed parallel beta-helix repeat-containing protein [Steroidobacteraceae bacterium]|nr:right-handed parallel beta-helix repeat-containing protein [Steroidobacteraceae bacterium]